MLIACNHPSLVGMDYRKDTEAVEPKAAKKDDEDDDADELAALMGGLGLTKRCQFCQTEYEFYLSWFIGCHIQTHLIFQAQLVKQGANRG